MDAPCRFLWMVISMCMAVSLTNGFKLTIMHTNDIHGRIQEINKDNGKCSSDEAAENKCYGGMERLKTKVDEIRSKYPNNSLLLDGGDLFKGTLFFYMFSGSIMSHFLNLLGYDAMNLGNHEFDRGPKGLKSFVDNATFHVLSCNTDLSETPFLSAIQKSAIVTVSGEQIGIIGYTTTETPQSSNPGKIKFKDEIESIQAAVNELTSKGVDKIIAIGHVGYAKDLEIAKKVRGVDLIVGGDSNTFLYNGPAPADEDPVGPYPTITLNPDGESVLVVQAFAYGKYLGFLQVDFDNQGKIKAWNGNPILMDKTVAKDSGMTQVIEALLTEMETKMNQNIGLSHVTLDGESEECRVHECNMGNLVADAMVRQNLKYADSTGWNHVGIAIINAGAIRSSIAKGVVTAMDCVNVLPFPDIVDIVKLTGAGILEVLEHSASDWYDKDHLSGGFLQISGLRVIYDMKQPKRNRVVVVDAICTECLIPQFKPLNKTKVYRVLLSSFIASGGEGYSMIRDKKGTYHIHGEGTSFSELLIKHITENTPITEGLDGRIRFLEDVVDSKFFLNDSNFVKSSSVLMFCVVTVLSLMLF